MGQKDFQATLDREVEEKKRRDMVSVINTTVIFFGGASLVFLIVIKLSVEYGRISPLFNSLLNFFIQRDLSAPAEGLIARMVKTPWLGILFLLLLIGGLILFRISRKRNRDTPNRAGWKKGMGVVLHMAVLLIIVALVLALSMGIYIRHVFRSAQAVERMDEGYRQAFLMAETELKNKTSAACLMVGKIMDDVESSRVSLDQLTDLDYINFAEVFCFFIDTQGGVITEREHYFRNYFSRAPETLDQMVNTILHDPEDRFRWKLLSARESTYHMMGKDGEYNLKFVSHDGHFEAVYNKEGILLIQGNDPVNMGTFNYGSIVLAPIKHEEYDVKPYERWNNVPNLGPISKQTSALMWEKYRNNPEAVKRYNDYANLLTER